jgi:membrane dipeptidase
MTAPFFLDAHLDLALNALEWNRDLTRPIAEIRAAEAGLRDKPGRGRGTVCLPEMRRGRIGLAVVTQIGKVARRGARPSRATVKPNDRGCPVAAWQSPAQAWAMTRGQLAWYRSLEEAGEIELIASRAALERHVAAWGNAQAAGSLPIGCVLSLEGADSLITPAHLERARAEGLRAVVDKGRYTQCL